MIIDKSDIVLVANNNTMFSIELKSLDTYIKAQSKFIYSFTSFSPIYSLNM